MRRLTQRRAGLLSYYVRQSSQIFQGQRMDSGECGFRTFKRLVCPGPNPHKHSATLVLAQLFSLFTAAQ